MTRASETRAARLAIVRALVDLRIVRSSVRGVYWQECTAEAEPLRRLSHESAERLDVASQQLRTAAWGGPGARRDTLRDRLREVERAWEDTHAALDGWSGVPAQLLPGDAALERLRAAVESLS